MSSVWWIVLAMNLSVHQDGPVGEPLSSVRDYVQDQRLESILANTYIHVEFQETPLHWAVHEIGEQLGLSTCLDYAALEEDGIAFDGPKTLLLENATARTALDLLLVNTFLTWSIKDAQLVVTTERSARNLRGWQAYPIDDLLHTEASYADERFAEKLRWVMVATIAPKEWDELGGLGRMVWDRENQVLWVYHSREVQAQVLHVLDALRFMQKQEGNAMVWLTLDSVLKIR